MKHEPFDPLSYAVTTEMVEVDGTRYFKATVSELPDVEVYESDQAKAYEVMMGTIADLYAAACHDHRPFPVPEVREDIEYSGRVTLRMGKELHRRLDSQARRNGTTLNAEIVSQLSETSSIEELSYSLACQFKGVSHLKVTTPALTSHSHHFLRVPRELGSTDADELYVSTVGSSLNLDLGIEDLFKAQPNRYSRVGLTETSGAAYPMTQEHRYA